MPQYTVERGYYLQCFVHITVEADTPEEAARIAMDEEAHSWDSSKFDYDGSGAPGVTGIWSGDTAYCGDALPIPQALTIPAGDRPLDREERQAVEHLRHIAIAFIGYDSGLMRASHQGERIARHALRATEALRLT